MNQRPSETEDRGTENSFVSVCTAWDDVAQLLPRSKLLIEPNSAKVPKNTSLLLISFPLWILSVSFPFIPFHSLSSHFIPFHSISFHVIPLHSTSFHFIPFQHLTWLLWTIDWRTIKAVTVHHIICLTLTKWLIAHDRCQDLRCGKYPNIHLPGFRVPGWSTFDMFCYYIATYRHILPHIATYWF